MKEEGWQERPPSNEGTTKLALPLASTRIVLDTARSIWTYLDQSGFIWIHLDFSQSMWMTLVFWCKEEEFILTLASVEVGRVLL